MKLINVDRILKISIEKKELVKYMNALSNIGDYLNDNIEVEKEVLVLKTFSTELVRIYNDASDY